MRNHTLSPFYLVTVLLVLLFSSCKKEENEPAGKGRFEDYKSCVVISPPPAVKLNAYYKKYLNCSGIPVVGSNAITDEALKDVDKIISFLLLGKDNVRARMIATGSFYVLTPKAEAGLAEVPDWQTQAKVGVGGETNPQLHIAVSGMDNVQCSPAVAAVSNVTHEFSHLMHFDAYRHLYPGFEPTLTTAWNKAKAKGIWKNTHLIQNIYEYFAAGVTIWYGVSYVGAPSTGDGNFNHIIRRSELQTYDPDLYTILAQYVHAGTDIPGCLKPVSSENISCVSTVTDVDGNIYPVVSIGSQCWMKTNLKTTKYRDGTLIENPTTPEAWESNTTGAWAFYNSSSANGDTYGKLYNGYAVSNAKGLCPNGWHIPSKAEFSQMLTQGGFQGGNFRALTGWNGNTPTTNSTGFSALPGGITNGSSFNDLGNVAYFWTSTQGDPSTTAYTRTIFHDTDFIGGNTEGKSKGLSCRCVKD